MLDAFKLKTTQNHMDTEVHYTRIYIVGCDMGKELRRLSRRKKIIEEMDKIMEHPEDALVIHYSCESFYDRNDGKTPRVTSIAVRNLNSGQTESFSIHKIAEQSGIDFSDIHMHYDELEKNMLEEYFQCVSENQGKTWIHWNMRDINYGFTALEHRLKALGGAPFVLPEGKKFDLARAMVALYGVGYIAHPRLINIIAKNNISDKDMLSGEQEVNAFDNKEYVKLHQSTLRKVDILANLFERAADRTLKTNSKWYEVYGFHPKVIVEIIKEHWLFSLLGVIVVIGSILSLLGLI